MDRLPKRAHSTVVRTNSIRLLAGNDNPGISDIPIITTPHFDLFPQYLTWLLDKALHKLNFHTLNKQ